MKKYSVAIIGCGSRGRDAYGKIFYSETDKWRITALCDTNNEQLLRTATECCVTPENCFLTEEEFFLKKRADVLVIATQDRDHVRMCCVALELGYDVLLEKPISPVKEELAELLCAQKKFNRKIVVCHVLRYAPAFLKIKQVLDRGEIGKLVCIEALEQVGYWHYSHSFVRGNWRKESETSPMILSKCCHDLDLLQYFAGSRCQDVYSVGGITYFKKDNQPKDAADRCFECNIKMNVFTVRKGFISSVGKNLVLRKTAGLLMWWIFTCPIRKSNCGRRIKTDRMDNAYLHAITTLPIIRP